MTKAEFIATLKQEVPDVFATKAAAEKAYNAFCSILAKAALTESGTRLPGVGTLALTQRSARTGRNPRTGVAIKIPARKSVKFTPAATLAEKAHKH
ncbi:HU family DNA-binding protein [Desulfovibrio cuneatus]|uniref:HU family DNA-binding protein n=1 Tax=Desulfovibrio cuneatus TaxID=159728 RepID=UPI00040019D2|nr:HU family DNA-binding protein [Desulfovibrio cuneatus]